MNLQNNMRDTRPCQIVSFFLHIYQAHNRQKHQKYYYITTDLKYYDRFFWLVTTHRFQEKVCKLKYHSEMCN